MKKKWLWRSGVVCQSWVCCFIQDGLREKTGMVVVWCVVGDEENMVVQKIDREFFSILGLLKKIRVPRLSFGF